MMSETVAPSVVIRPVPVDDAMLHTRVLVAELDGQVVGHGLVRLIRSRKRRIGRIGLHADERFGERSSSTRAGASSQSGWTRIVRRS